MMGESAVESDFRVGNEPSRQQGRSLARMRGLLAMGESLSCGSEKKGLFCFLPNEAGMLLKTKGRAWGKLERSRNVIENGGLWSKIRNVIETKGR